ncbi:hypothetical protein PQR67_22290 [Paraburkholderia fungorum]
MVVALIVFCFSNEMSQFMNDGRYLLNVRRFVEAGAQRNGTPLAQSLIVWRVSVRQVGTLIPMRFNP